MDKRKQEENDKEQETGKVKEAKGCEEVKQQDGFELDRGGNEEPGKKMAWNR